MSSTALPEAGRLLAIGDVHGCDIALETLLREIAPAKADTIVLLGDIVDRGPNTKRCIEIIFELQKACRVISIMGNHEEMFLDAINGGRWQRSWMQNGGVEMLDSYGGLVDDIPVEHLDYIRSMQEYYEAEWDLFTHGTPYFDAPIEEQTAQGLRWNRIVGREPPHCSGKRVICGHTAQRNGVPLVFMGYVCLDTNAYGGGALSALDVNADQVFQSEQSGYYRGRFPLDQFQQY
ncbi:MAG TPA: metallophosphoesterase family protein [Caulifigura sp.]|nr:metallophosphoesterase family protein [Caulifigura sp.]